MIGTSRSGSSSSSITCCSTTLVCGELPDGRPDVSWCGRKGERNALFADSLVCTGMRLGEGSSLLVTGVPLPVHGLQRVRRDVHLSAARLAQLSASIKAVT